MLGAAGLVLLPADPAPLPAPTQDAVTPVASSTPGKYCHDGVCEQTFTADGVWKQPGATGDVTVEIAGAAGGYSGDGTEGGRGEVITLSSPKRHISFNVGGLGADGDGKNGGAGGKGGGGEGGDAADGADGGGGGGATYLADEDGDRLAVAAGGGGGGGGFANGDQANGYEPRYFSPGADGGFIGAGRDGTIGYYRTNARCESQAGKGGAGTGIARSGGGGGTGGRDHGTDGKAPIFGYGGGGGGGGAGDLGGGGGGCGNQDVFGNGQDGYSGQGGRGGGNGDVFDCVQIACTTAQSKNGGGGGGGGIFGGGGGGAGRGIAAGGGGGGASWAATGASVTHTGFNDGGGYVKFTWRIPTPQLALTIPSTVTSQGPGEPVSIPIRVTNRQSGSGSAGKISMADEFGNTSTVQRCATNDPQNVANGNLGNFCKVAPTVDTVYQIAYEPSRQYAADGAYADRQTLQLRVNVGKERSTTTMETPDTVVAGDPVPLRATVTAPTQRPEGWVTFEYRNGGTWSPAAQAPTVVQPGGKTAVAEASAVGVPASADRVRARYDGSTTLATSTSTEMALNSISAPLTLDISSADLSWGESVSLVATAPRCTSGQVRLLDVDTSGRTNGVELRTATIGADHKAYFTLTPEVGSLVVSARAGMECAGSGTNFSTPWQLISTTAAPTTTTVTTARDGDTTQVTVRVASDATVPDGSVGVQWSTPTGAGRATAQLVDGVVTVPATGLQPGDSDITATYVGTTQFRTSTSTVAVHGERLPTTVTLAPIPATVPVKGTVPVVATVRSGDRLVRDGTVTIANQRVELDLGEARLNLTVTAGLGPIYGVPVDFLGDDTYAPSFAEFDVEVVPAAVTLSATQVGQASTDGTVQFSVSATTTSAGTTEAPAGAVTVKRTGDATGTRVPLQSCQTCSAREALVTLPAPAAGSHTYTFTYTDRSGRTSAPSIARTVEVVARTVPTFETQGSRTIALGETYGIRAVVRGSQDGPAPTGAVELYDGNELVGSAPNLTGLAYTPTWVGTRTLSARYVGDAVHEAAQTDDYVTLTVTAYRPVLSLTATDGQGTPVEDGGTVAPGTPVTLTVGARQRHTPPTPSSGVTGTAEVTGPGLTDPAQVPLTDGTGSVTVTDTTELGLRRFTASLPGTDRSEAASVLRTFYVRAATATTPGATSYAASPGSEVTIPVSVTSGGSPITGGTVVLRDGDRDLATATPGPTTQLRFTPDWAGARELTLTYVTSATHTGSTASVAVDVQASPAPRTATTVAPGAVSTSGSRMVVPFSVTDAAGAVTGGEVTLLDGQRVLGTTTAGPGSSFTVTPDWTGSRTLRISYAGSTTHQPSGADVAVTAPLPPVVQPTATSVSAFWTLDEGTVTVPVFVLSRSGLVTGGELSLYDGGTRLDTVTAGAGEAFAFTPDWTGSRTLRISYAGTPTHLASSTTLEVTVPGPPVDPTDPTDPPTTPAATSVAPAAAAYSVGQGRSVTVPVTVTSAGSAVTGGTVELYDGGTRLTTTSAGPGAAFTFTPTWTGSRTLRIAYLGTGTLAASAAEVTVEVTDPVDPPTVRPTLSAVAPGRLYRGSEQAVTVAGTGFTDETRLVSPGGGVRIVDQTVLSNRRIVARVVVGTWADLGSRAWALRDAGGTVACTGPRACDLTVVSSPEVAERAPSVLRRGATTTVTLLGTGFVEGLQAVVTGSGVRVESVRVRSAKRVVLVLSSTGDAALGRRTLLLTNPDGGQTQVDDALRLRR